MSLPAPATRPLALVVEDEPGVRLVLRDLLADEGYEVEEAGDGEAALDRLLHAGSDAREPDVLLLDLGLPGLSGLQVLRALRAEARSSRLAVVVVSAYAMLLSDADAALADAVVRKPFDADGLFAAIRLARMAAAAAPLPPAP